VFSFSSAAAGSATAAPEAIAVGMRTTFAIAALMMAFALAIPAASRLICRAGRTV
jgi:hypothetical protein